ncbi:MAG: hypothetical protein U1F35_16575 [Steroidobacteraceae bacterium]
MKPDVPSVLDAVIRGLELKQSSLPPGPELAMTVGMKILLSVLRRDWDSAASRPASECRQVIALLRQGAEIVPAALRTRLLAAIRCAEGSADELRVAELERTLDGLLTAAIELQAWLEDETGVEAKDLLQKMWSFLAAMNQSRALQVRLW